MIGTNWGVCERGYKVRGDSCAHDDECRAFDFIEGIGCADGICGGCGVMCTDGCHYDATECPSEVVAGFGNCINGCVSGNNLRILRDVSLTHCMYLCYLENRNSGIGSIFGFNECEGVEYFTGDSDNYSA